MAKFILEYRIVVEAEDFDEAECLAIDLEGDIRHCNKRVVSVDCDTYVEEI